MRLEGSANARQKRSRRRRAALERRRALKKLDRAVRRRMLAFV